MNLISLVLIGSKNTKGPWLNLLKVKSLIISYRYLPLYKNKYYNEHVMCTEPLQTFKDIVYISRKTDHLFMDCNATRHFMLLS